MNADFRNITNKRQWNATIGMTEEEFHHLTEKFGDSFRRMFGKELWERQEGSTTKARFTEYADYLFFILFSLKAVLWVGDTSNKSQRLGNFLERKNDRNDK